jgi:amino acid adenylation domain-containing protein
MRDSGNSGEVSARSAIQMIDAVARSMPDSIALRGNDSQMTYREMMHRADWLAGQLQAAGVARDVPVGICLDRSFDYVIAMLAASKAGGAFMPLDPNWPEERLRFAMEDSGAPVVVTSSFSFARFLQTGRTVLSADTKTESRRGTTSLPCTPAGRDDLAYLIYTSGSTGGPKGVEITQGNLLGLIRWHCKEFAVTPQDRASSVAGLGFDAAVWEIWPYLCIGASVSLAADDVRASWQALRGWLVDEQISMAFVPTPTAEPMISAEWPPRTALRYLLTGGDTLHVRPSDSLPFSVINNYGPTECTVVATSGRVEPIGAAVPSIGRAIAGAQIHILDEHRRPVAAGEIGEIYIGGTGVGRGYRRRPELTAERFTTDTKNDTRLYRTGDLARWLPNGQIAFHGRRDGLVKIRGHRVEPEEISAILSAHPLVGQCFVTARGDGPDVTLVAYVVPTPGSTPRAGELRSFLGMRLPDFMLPSAFVGMASLPLSTSGKLDRRALPEPSAANTLSSAEYREPASVVECEIAAIIAKLLKLDRVGLDDNFFLLGGHSLLGTQLVLRAQDAFGIELTLRDLFQTQTVAKLAATIEQRILAHMEPMGIEEAGQLVAS